MLNVTTLVVAEGVSVDAFTGRITPFNLVDTVFAPTFPARVARLHVLVQYERDPGAAPFHGFEKMELLAPTGGDVLNAPAQELTVGTRFHSSIHNAWNVQLNMEGPYILAVKHAERVEGPWTVLQQRTVVVERGRHPLQPQLPIP